ncbi:MAG TPA: hypothetical protein VEK08_11645 [Planctomycetota bacterium]|nr:hypothetical protein [Planctomycetota bacterium]
MQRCRTLLVVFLLISAAVARSADDVAQANTKFAIPSGPGMRGWNAYLENDFAAAETAFNEALKGQPRELTLLEGLRSVYIATGDYKKAQAINLQMVEAAADNPLCGVFATRAMDAMPFVESRADVIATFTRVAQKAAPAVSALLKDNLATVYQRINKTDEAKKALENIGYIDKWLYVAGPFGSKDKNNVIERRFAPERPLKALEFSSDHGEKIHVHKDVKVSHRELNIDSLFPGARGVFYAFTNLESDSDQDIVIGVSAALPYRLFLRGMPVLVEPEDDDPRRAGGELIRTRLVKGNNPLLFKASAAASVVVRILGSDYGPPKGVKVKGGSDTLLASHNVTAVRGYVFSSKIAGSISDYFIQRFAKEPWAGTGRFALRNIAEYAPLTVPEAVWFELALQRENDALARAAIARRLSLYDSSAGLLDVSASILASAGTLLGNSEAREHEESRQMRERALQKVPTSHQHLLALHHFYDRGDLQEQAFDKIKACVDAHPQSPLALAELGMAYQRRQFYVEAEKCFEKAAELDAAYLYRLIGFHQAFGSRARADELRKRQQELGLIDYAGQFAEALQRGELDRADKILQEQEKAFPDRKDEFSQDRVRLLMERGDLKEAYKQQRKLYDSQTRFRGNKRNVLVSLVEIAIRLDKFDEAKTLLSDYLKEHSGDNELRQKLSELDGSITQRWWEPYDVKVPQVDTSRFTTENYPAANHAWIVDFMVTRVNPDLSSESYVHIAQKVLNLQGINELSELLVRAQRQEMVFVRTLNPDGSAFQPQNVHDFNLAQSASLYKVGPGSILEHAYTMDSAVDEDEPYFNMAFNFNAIDSPRAISRWVLMVPNSVKDKLNFRKVRGDLIEEKILEGPPGFTVYQWTNKQVEGMKAENFMPVEVDQETVPLVLVDSPERPFRANGWLMRREKQSIPAEAITQAQSLVTSSFFKTLDDGRKFDAIIAWVRANIKNGNDSRTLSDVWFTRSGRPDQMAALAREMAISVGLSVRMAYVNGAYVPGRMWKSKNARRQWEPAELANFGSGGRMLVLEQPVGPDRWAQFFGRNPKFYWPNDVNAGQNGALALTLSDDGARIKRVRGESLGITPSAARLRVAMDADGTGNVKGSLQMFGNVGGNWREALSDPRQNAQIKEYVIRYAWPKSQITDVQVAGADQAELPLVFTYSCVVKGLAAPADEAMFLNPFVSKVRLLDLRGPPEREHDLLIKEEISELDHTLVYVAPENHAWVEVPDDLFICTEFGFYLVDYNVQGKVLTCTRSYLMPQQRVTPAKYPALLDFLSQISASASQRIGYAPIKDETIGSMKHEMYSMGYAGYGESAAKKK